MLEACKGCPYIVQIRSWSSSGPRDHRLELELMDEGSLFSLVKKFPSKCNQADKLETFLMCAAWFTLQGLKFLHEKLSMVHADVKPENILVNSKGQVKLSDFNCACKESTAKAAYTPSGTVAFMSPERLNGLPARRSSDTWSLGMTLLFILHSLSVVSFPPFETLFDITSWATSPDSTQDDCLLEALSSLSPSSPLSVLIKQCLVKDVSCRPTPSGLLSSFQAFSEFNHDSQLSFISDVICWLKR